MRGKNEKTKYVPGFLRKTRLDPAVVVHTYFREWEKRHLELKRRRSKAKFYPAICFSRKIGVGVLETADILSKKIGYRVIDREILEHIAKDKNLSEKAVAFLNEQYPDILTEYLSWIVGEKAFAKSESINALFKTILSFATLEPSIFVGRGAYLLLPREQILAVRFIASDEHRIKRVANLLNITRKEAAKNLDQADKEQRLFFKQVYGKKSVTPDEFDMVINFDYVHKPRWAAEIVAQAFKEKFGTISVDSTINKGITV